MNAAATLNAIKEEIKNGNYMTFGNSKKYTMSVGLSGAAIRSLVKSGMIEKLNHRFYKQFYAVTEKGEAV